ncbi:MAG: menaquinone biosynthesis protein [Proteobacteria bacterium]|nr:menaquinone biosynthesis protein [Pseudomonadota bacterium]
MIRIGHIDFINMIPLDIGDSDPRLDFEKIRGVPSALNGMLLNNEIDVSVISSAFYLEHMDDLTRIGSFGISSDGPVMSVLLFSSIDLSRFPRSKTLKVFETPQSATSLLLNRLILKHNYGLEKVSVPVFQDADAYLLIGDEALRELQMQRRPHIYDLGIEWKRLTGLPMVFAVLAANRYAFEEKRGEIEIYLRILSASHSELMKDSVAVAQRARERLPLSQELIVKYYSCLRYEIGEKEEQSITLFGKLIKEAGNPSLAPE